MIRVPLSLLGGVALALVLFWLLALLVAPPQADIEVLEPTSLSLVEAEAPAEQAVAEAAQEAVPPPPSAPPPPMPEPAPIAESPLALPEPELPTAPATSPELEASLPELDEVEPVPEPEPRPEPERQSEPDPTPREPTEAPPGEAVAAATVEVSDSSTDPVDVGAISPTSRVPPQYPVRAQRRGQEGHVELSFLIRPDGRVDPDSIEVVEARPRNVFDRTARRAVAQWQFAPAEGLRRARQRLEFRLR